MLVFFKLSVVIKILIVFFTGLYGYDVGGEEAGKSFFAKFFSGFSHFSFGDSLRFSLKLFRFSL